MSRIYCQSCGNDFDNDDQCGAIYYPIAKCEDCIQDEEDRIQEEKERKAFKQSPDMSALRHAWSTRGVL